MFRSGFAVEEFLHHDAVEAVGETADGVSLGFEAEGESSVVLVRRGGEGEGEGDLNRGGVIGSHEPALLLLRAKQSE